MTYYEPSPDLRPYKVSVTILRGNHYCLHLMDEEVECTSSLELEREDDHNFLWPMELSTYDNGYHRKELY